MASFLRKSLVAMLLIIAASCFVYVLYLDSYYELNGARAPQPQSGRIYPKTVHHGTRVFLTKAEKLEFNVVLPSVSILCAGAGIYLAVRWKYASSRLGGEPDLSVPIAYKKKNEAD
jgi:hypothetical protein